ncbi:MAG TPA: RIP metalloprotease RseP [Bryobacteraceae bacterium]|nr:RIP metalloprotease RseP [Bryobacteraceae bacterium]
MIGFENFAWLLVLIGVMILVHEAGHYWAARSFDVRIEVFSFGFGPRLFGFKRGETDFRFSAILFGGYVKMAGEQPTDDNVDDPRAFLAKPRWQRLIIAFAGPAMNMVLAVALLTGMYMVRYPKTPPSAQEGIVGFVTPNTPAAKAGIREGDRIVTLDDQQRPSWEDITIKEVSNANHPLAVRIDRGGREFWTSVVPKLDERSGLGMAGWQPQGEIEIAELSPGMPAQKANLQRGDILLTANGQPLRSTDGLHRIVEAADGKPVTLEYRHGGTTYSVAVQPIFSKEGGPGRWMIGVYPDYRVVMTKLQFPQALGESVRQNVKSATLIFQFLKGIAEHRMSPKSISGPIGIAHYAGDAAREGLLPFLALMAMVSLNLAVINLLPIPILDGGVILMLLVEMIMRRDLSLRVKETLFKLGFVFLMAIMAFVIYNDIAKTFPG